MGHSSLTIFDENNFLSLVYLGRDFSEKMVFDGALEMLKSNKITCGQFEVGPTLTEAGTSEQEITQLLNSFGCFAPADSLLAHSSGKSGRRSSQCTLLMRTASASETVTRK